MDRAITILYLVYLVIELAYFVSCVVAVVRIIKYSRTHSDNRIIALSTLTFLFACILGSIVHNIPNRFGKGAAQIFSIFLVIELLYLLVITVIALRSKKLKIAFSILLIAGLLFIPFFAAGQWNESTYDPLFAYESLIATSISFAYFIQLGDDIKNINLLKDPITLIMLGLFFCYSLPFAYSTTMATINFFDPNFYPNMEKSSTDRMLLVFVSRVGTICYLIFNIFIYKAFECRTPARVGI